MMRSIMILFTLCLVFLPDLEAAQKRAGNSRGYDVDILLDTFAYDAADIDANIDTVFQGCPKRDCIPSIDRPQFLNTAEVEYLDADDLVLSISHAGVTRAYPTRFLDRHEIVNDQFGEIPVAVTYCPLCGSGLAFIRVLDGAEVELGVSGLLHNSDLIMYDRQTESLWQQITGIAIAGPKRGSRLEALPATMSLWEDWKGANPDAEVLAPPADLKHYKKFVYGDYTTSDRLLFPVKTQDARLHRKKVIYGAEIGTQSVAVEAGWLQKAGNWEHEIEGQMLRLELDSAGAVVGTLDDRPIPIHRMYWFAWYSFHPDTSLIH
jgi:hypothetical protein